MSGKRRAFAFGAAALALALAVACGGKSVDTNNCFAETSSCDGTKLIFNSCTPGASTVTECAATHESCIYIANKALCGTDCASDSDCALTPSTPACTADPTDVNGQMYCSTFVAEGQSCAVLGNRCEPGTNCEATVRTRIVADAGADASDAAMKNDAGDAGDGDAGFVVTYESCSANEACTCIRSM